MPVTFFKLLVTYALHYRNLPAVSHFQPSLILEGKAGAYPSGAPYGSTLQV
jgi:hypothetical protein